MTLNDEENTIIARWLTRNIDWYEDEAKRIEYGNDNAAVIGSFSVAKGHVRSANTLRGLLGGFSK